LVYALDVVVVANVVDGVLDRPAVSQWVLAFLWRWTSAIAASIDSFAHAALKIVGDVLHAGAIL